MASHIGDHIDKGRYKRRPRYTVVLYDVREKMKLSTNTYAVIDSIHKLSSSNPRYPYSTMSKADLASFLDLSRATIFRAIDERLKKRLIERSPDQSHHLRATGKWIHTVETFEIRSRR